MIFQLALYTYQGNKNPFLSDWRALSCFLLGTEEILNISVIFASLITILLPFRYTLLLLLELLLKKSRLAFTEYRFFLPVFGKCLLLFFSFLVVIMCFSWVFLFVACCFSKCPFHQLSLMNLNRLLIQKFFLKYSK